MSDLPQEAIHFIEAVTAHFGAPAAVIFHNKQKAVSMTKRFDDTNRGVLFRDDKKAKPEDRDYSGSINIAGTDYWLSGWIKTSKAGSKFLFRFRSSPKRRSKLSPTLMMKSNFKVPHVFAHQQNQRTL